MWLIVGLGNPGSEYAKTRHNIGFMAADAIARHYNFPDFRSKFKGLCTEGMAGTEKLLLLKPQTYMNLSGSSVLEAAQFYKIPLEQIIVIYDELDLVFGKIRVKTGGGAAGHNGIRDIDQRMGNGYIRVRFGIGHPGDKERVTGHVLGAFAPDEHKRLEEILFPAFMHGFPYLLKNDAPRFLNEYALKTVDSQ